MTDGIARDDAVALLLEEVAALRAEVSALKAERGPDRELRSPVPDGGSVTADGSPDDRVSRRDLIKRLGGAAAVGGIGLAVAGSVLAPESAAATTGAMQFGETNDAGEDSTVLRSTGGGNTFEAQNFHSGGPSTFAAVKGLCTNGFGVVGASTNGHGVVGASDNLIGVLGTSDFIGVLAVGSVPLLVDPAPAPGPPTTGKHGKGEVYVDADGVQWLGIGDGEFGTATPPSFVKNITSGANDTGTQTTTIQTGGPGPAVEGVGSSSGRGLQASGGAAQLRLVPASSPGHPASGQIGDLFLDSTGALFLCQGDTDWKTVALSQGQPRRP